VLYAEAGVQVGDTNAASILYQLIEPWRDLLVWNGTIGYGSMHTWLGLLAAALGWDERADQHLTYACEFHETNGLPPWAARAHPRWGEALGRRGETARAPRGGNPSALAWTRRYGAASLPPA
jgi:hypothetical protein